MLPSGPRTERRMLRKFSVIEGGDEDRRQAQEREERIAQDPDSMTLADAFERLPAVLEANREFILSKYGLPDFGEMSKEEEMAWKVRQAKLETNNDERYVLYRKLSSAYRKRGYSERGDSINLMTYCADAPIAEIKRHTWRIQRNMDEPMFGLEKSRPVRNAVRTFEYRAFVNLCRECEQELRRQTEAAGDERSSWKKDRKSFYESDVGFYEFRWDERYITYGKGWAFSYFPYEEPLTCARCGDSDLELYRNQIS